MASECKLRQIKFSHDKESKILSFTGKVEKKKVQTDTPGKYITHYLFECYDITLPQALKSLMTCWRYGNAEEMSASSLKSSLEEHHRTGNRKDNHIPNLCRGRLN